MCAITANSYTGRYIQKGNGVLTLVRKYVRGGKRLIETTVKIRVHQRTDDTISAVHPCYIGRCENYISSVHMNR